MDINNSFLELPSRNLAVEQDINLTVRPMLKLRQTEVSQNPANQCSTRPNIPTLTRQVPASGVEHLGREVNHWDFRDVVRSTTDTGTERAQTDG